jgi:uncharacterized membrane protein YdjX (TVP38/TMEM64 family)
MRPPPRDRATASSLREAVSGAINDLTLAIVFSLILLTVLCLVRMVLRRDWIVSAAFAAVVALMISASYAADFRAPPGALVVIVYGAIYGAAWGTLLVRFGLIAFIAHQTSTRCCRPS